MANGRQASVKRLKMAERAQQQMDVHFPNMPDAMILRRKTNDGFTTVPRTLPIVMQAVVSDSIGTEHLETQASTTHSTVTDFAKFLGLSTSVPRAHAV